MKYPFVWRLGSVGVFVTLASLVSSCEKKPPSQSSPSPSNSSPSASSGRTTSSAPSSAPSAAAASSVRIQESGKKRVATTKDRAAFKQYESAMGQGRVATQKKQWDKASAAFTKALEALPNDPRALAERGYASLLAGELDDAERDFNAVSGSADNELWAQVWFNRGLVFEKRGNSQSALEAFAMSQSLVPTKAAAAKLSGKSLCPVGTQRITAQRFPSWTEFWKGAVRDTWLKYNDRADEPKDDSAVKRVLGVTACSPVCAAHLSTDEDIYHVVAPTSSPHPSLVVFANVFRTFQHRCGGAAEVKLRSGPVPSIRFLAINNEYSMICSPGAPPDEPCMTGCVEGSWLAVTAFVDVAKSGLLRLQQTGPVGENEVQVPPATVVDGQVRLAGCASPISILP